MKTFLQWLETNGNGNGAGALPQHAQASIQQFQQGEQTQGLKALQQAQIEINYQTFGAGNIERMKKLIQTALNDYGEQSIMGKTLLPLLQMLQQQEELAKQGQPLDPFALQTLRASIPNAIKQAMGDYKDVRLK